MAKIDEILGSISPLYGAISGQGLIGNALGGLGEALGPTAGLGTMLAREQRKKLRANRATDAKKAAEEAVTDDAIAARGGMRRGGAVKKMAGGGATKKMPSLADSVASGNRMSGKEEAPFRTPKPKFGPTPAERAASKAQDERLKNAKVTRGEVRTLNSANRSEGGVKMAKGGSTASRRADGCATRGKTRGKIY